MSWRRFRSVKARVEFVANQGPNTVAAVLKRLSASAVALGVVAAFATRAGVTATLPYFRRIAERGRVKVVVGLYQGVTEPAAAVQGR